MAALLAALLFTAACLIVAGVTLMATPAGLVVAGVLLACWSLVVFRGVDAQ